MYKRIMPEWLSEKEFERGARFIIILCGVSLFSFFFLSFFMGYLQNITTIMSSWVLEFLDIKTKVTGNILLLDSLGFPVEVIPLCVGDIEISVLVGAIIATEDRTFKNRLQGVFGGIAFIILFNPLRIGLTIASGVWGSIHLMEFIHSFLFRVFLLISIVGFYVFWYLGWPALRIKFKKN